MSENGHGGSPGSSLRTVKCEASRNFKWSITNSGVLTPTYKCTLPSDDAPGGMADEQPLFQISKTNPQSPFWTMWYYAYAGRESHIHVCFIHHADTNRRADLIPPKRIQFGHISKSITPDGKPVTGGGTRVTITGKSDEEKAVWKTLGEGNEDMVEWAVICAALHALDDEIVKAAEAAGIRIGVLPGSTQKGPAGHASTPPMPNNMQRPQLHPTGQPMLKGSQSGAPGPQGPVPQGVMPSIRGPPPPQQHAGGPPGPDPRMMQQRPPQQRGPPPAQPPQQHLSSAQQAMSPQQQPNGRAGPPMQMPMPQPQPHMQQAGPPPPQAQQNGERRRLLSNNNRPRPQQQPLPGSFAPAPQQTFSPPPQQMPLSPDQHMQNAPRSGIMAPPLNARPPPHAQQSNGHHMQPGFIPPQYANGQAGPSNGMGPPNGQMRLPGSAPPVSLSALRGARSPLPVPGSSAPVPRRQSPPMALQPSAGPYKAPPRSGSMRPPSDPAQYSRSPQAPFVQMAPPESPRRDRFPTAPPQQRSPQKQYSAPPPRELEEEDTVDSVAFMLGTTGLNDAAAGDDDDEAISPRYRGPVSSSGNARESGSRVNRLLKSRS